MLSSDWPRPAPSWASRSGIISAVAAELPASQPCRHCPTSSAAAEGQRKARARDSAHLTYCPPKHLSMLIFSYGVAHLGVVSDTMSCAGYQPLAVGISVGIAHPCWYRASEEDAAMPLTDARCRSAQPG